MNCPKCGHPLALNNTFCEYCGYNADAGMETPTGTENPIVTDNPTTGPEVTGKKSNPLGGLLGAVIGAVLGMAVIVLFSQMNVVAALGGLALAFFTTKGYELLGGKLDGKGKIICLALIAIAPYLADRIDWAIIVVRDLGWSFTEAFAYIPDMITSGMIESSVYYSNLGQLYLFSLLGAIGIIAGMFQKKKAA